MWRTCIAAFLGICVSTGTALGDDKSECETGIAFIKAEIAKNPTAPVLEKLNEALKDGERELAEGEFDECFEAIEDARIALQGG